MIKHGSRSLPGIEVASYSLMLKDAGGFVGDRASGRAFFDILDELRNPLSAIGRDPFGETATEDLSNKDLDKKWRKGDAFAAGLVHSVVEEFAQRLANVVRSYQEADDAWAQVSRIAVGGGFRDSRIGEIAIGRTTTILRLEGMPVDLVPISQDPDEAALIGGLRLLPKERLQGCRQMLTVDIGGSSIRAGLVDFDPDHPHDLSAASLASHDQWKYGDEKKEPSREDAVDRLARMLDKLRERARKHLASYVTVACPGRISENGDIRDGAQNLPGDWEAKEFNLPKALREKLKSRKFAPEVVMHNDAVVQGLSEIEAMADVTNWAVVTIGTGLGNAVYRNV